MDVHNVYSIEHSNQQLLLLTVIVTIILKIQKENERKKYKIYVNQQLIQYITIIVLYHYYKVERTFQ